MTNIDYDLKEVKELVKQIQQETKLSYYNL